MPSNFLNRRTVLSSAIGLAGLSLVPSPVLALSEANARKMVDQLVSEINRVIASGKSESGMISEFEAIFVRYADVSIMARYALGNDARSASAAQVSRFTKAFQSYIARKYGKRFREFIGGKITVQSTRQIKAGYEIRATADLQGQAPFDVTFLISDKSGRDLFFNMFIEGVNLLLTERTEIGAMLDRRKGNIDQLIADLASSG